MYEKKWFILLIKNNLTNKIIINSKMKNCMKSKFILRKGIIFSLVCMFLVTSCYRIDNLGGVFDGDKMLPPELMLPIGVLDMNIMRILDQINLSDGMEIRESGGDTVSIFYSITEDFDFKIPELDYSKFGTIERTLTTSATNIELLEIDINEDINVEHIESVLLSVFDVRLEITATGTVDWSGIQITTELYHNVTQMDETGRIEQGNVAPETHHLGDGQSVLISYRNIWVTPTNYNTLPMTVTVTAEAGAIPAGSSITYTYSVEKADWRVAFGLFPASMIARNPNQIHDFDISDFDGFRFYDPRINISVRHNVGTSFRFWVDFIEAFNSVDPIGTSVRAWFNNANTGWMDSDSTFADVYRRPARWWSEPETAFIGRFDRHDGRTNLLFDDEVTPNRLRYSFSAESYRVSPDPIGTPHFITPDAFVTVTASAEIPLWLRERRPGEERGYQLTDTVFDLDLENTLPTNSVDLDEVRLELRINNGLPFDVIFEIIAFLDKDGNRIDVPNFEIDERIQAPPTNADGTANHAAVQRQIVAIEINDEQFEKIRFADQMVFRMHADLMDHPESHIRITANDFFRIQVGVFVKGDLNTGMFNNNND